MCESAEMRWYSRAMAVVLQTNVRSVQGGSRNGRARPLHGEGLGLARRRRPLAPLARGEAHGRGHPRAWIPLGEALPARADRRAGLERLAPRLRPRIARRAGAVPPQRGA